MCYSIVDKSSFNNIKTKWKPEVDSHWASAKVILVGTKLDLRIEGNNDHVTFEEGLKLSKEIKTDGFFETSALNYINLNVFKQ